MRYFLGFLISIGLIIVLIFLLFHGGGSKAKVPTTAKTLESYASTDAEVRLTIDGPVNSQQEHQQIRVTVDRSQATFEQISGYEGQVVQQQQFASNDNAFQVFLHSLGHAGFTQGNTDKSLSDERGYCPLGDRYIFELIQNGQSIERFWATSCGKPKTYLGSLDLTLSLFKAQIPKYSDLTDNVVL
jgi:hypothetical protein